MAVMEELKNRKLEQGEVKANPMDILRDEIRGKKVLLLGFGREGLSSLNLLKKIGGYREIAIADRNQVKCTDDTVQLYVGENYQEVIDSYEYVVKSPGVVLEKDFKDYKAYITSQMEIFLKIFSKQVIGITGTKGKSTTTSLVYHVLKETGQNPILCGNIGIPPFDCFEQMKENSVAVVEMSSHQLEFTRYSPHIGVLLNVHEEHLDHYGTFEKYKNAKCNVFHHMKEQDILFINVENQEEAQNTAAIVRGVSFEGESLTHEEENDCMKPELLEKYREQAYVHIDAKKAEVQVLGQSFTIPTDNIQLLGHHNYFNIAVAFSICKEYGVEWATFEEALKTFEPLPHRLKFVGEKDGILFYDDSISTISETAIQAMNSIANVGTILIGGMDRGIDYSPLLADLATREIDHIVCMYATGKRIYEEAKERNLATLSHFYVVEDLEEAVAYAKKVTTKGKACVLSPAAASYGYFKNFEERGDVFASLALK